MIDVKDAARYLLSLFKEDADKRVVGGDDIADISNLKLQKLLYYCQAYSYGLTGKPMFSEQIEAWVYGPVVPSVYQEYKKYESRNIPLSDIEQFSLPDDSTDSAIIKLVKEQKGQYSAIALKDMTHKETPWIEAFAICKNQPIEAETMREYFREKLCGDITEEEEERLWESMTEPLDEDDMKELLRCVSV